MPVHLYGRLCNMKEILAISKKYNLLIIEDSAQSHGASFNDTYSGALGMQPVLVFIQEKI